MKQKALEQYHDDISSLSGRICDLQYDQTEHGFLGSNQKAILKSSDVSVDDCDTDIVKFIGEVRGWQKELRTTIAQKIAMVEVLRHQADIYKKILESTNTTSYLHALD